MNRISVFYEHMAEAMKQENITLDESVRGGKTLWL